jgi:hypothetical protein
MFLRTEVRAPGAKRELLHAATNDVMTRQCCFGSLAAYELDLEPAAILIWGLFFAFLIPK